MKSTAAWILDIITDFGCLKILGDPDVY